MGKTGICVLIVVLLGVVTAGCSTPQGVGDYFQDRRQDLIDVVHLDFSVANVGAIVYVGPFGLGWNALTDPEKEGEDSKTLQLGLGGPRFQGREGAAWSFIWNIEHWNDDESTIGPRPKRTPSCGSVGISAGFVFGVGVEADIFELVDFVLGIFCVDVMQDDEPREEPVEPPDPKATVKEF
jgi:predicted small secreted protein